MIKEISIELVLFTIYPIIVAIRKIEELNYLDIIYFEKSRIGYKKIATMLNIVSYLAVAIINFGMILSNQETEIIKYLITMGAVAWGYLRHKRLYNSIEDIYEGMLAYTTLSYTFTESSSTVYIGCVMVLITSISAGVQKLKSKMWREKKGNGLIKFCMLPSISRELVRNLINKSIKNKIIYNLLNIASIATPYIQIFSPIIIITAFCTENSILLNVGICIQFIFIGMLFVIADLSWITSYYAIMILLIILSNQWISNIFSEEKITTTAINVIMMMYGIASTYFLFREENGKHLSKLRKICLDIVPFRMFTEVHTKNIMTYYLEENNIERNMGQERGKIQKLNAFNENGIRSNSQTLKSRLGQGLMYPIGDYFTNYYRNKTKYSDLVNKRRMMKILAIKNLEKITIFQHSWNESDLKYESIEVAVAYKKDEFKPRFRSKISEQNR